MPTTAEHTPQIDPSLFVIHFDVSDEYIKLDTFWRTAKSAERAANAINDAVFGGQLSFELVILPPESGTFLAKLTFLVSAVGALAAASESSFVQGYIEGLTGKSMEQWGDELGKSHKQKVSRIGEEPASDPEPLTVSGTLPSPTLEGCVLAQMSRGLLEKNDDELAAAGLDSEFFDEARDARADFFDACIADRDISRIGFTPTHEFPIPRKQFPERARRPERREPEDTDPNWQSGVASIHVTSPNWDRSDRLRSWKGKETTGRDCFFTIEDDNFWRFVEIKNLPVEVLDQLRVQWAWQSGPGRPKTRRVLKVLEFNGQRISQRLSDDEIKDILGEVAVTREARRERGLFDD